MGHMTPNFSRSEFACKGTVCCGGSAPVSQSLADACQLIRDILDCPLHILSGFRCITHNRAVQGSPRSMHMLARAVDIAVPPERTLVDLYAAAQAAQGFRYGGIGLYPDMHFIHLDMRAEPASWGIYAGQAVTLEWALTTEEAKSSAVPS